MGFLFYAIQIKLPAFIPSLDILTHLRSLFTLALTRLGIYKPPLEQEQEGPNSGDNNEIFILDSSSPSLVPIPVHTVTAAIKRKVPIIQYQDFVQRLGEMGSDSDQKKEGEMRIRKGTKETQQTLISSHEIGEIDGVGKEKGGRFFACDVSQPQIQRPHLHRHLTLTSSTWTRND